MSLSQAVMSIDDRVAQTQSQRQELAADISAEIASMEMRLEHLRRMRHALLGETEEAPRPIQQATEAAGVNSWGRWSDGKPVR